MGKQKPTGNVRWGILGTGRVSDQFCTQLKKVPGVEICRVWSRAPANAAGLASRHGIPKSTSSLEEFLGAGGLDLVYICTPTALHEVHSLACLDAGYGVLCEKPLTTSLASAQRIFSKAKENNLFCMEGMWMRFNPLVQKAQELIGSGAIGDLISARVELGYDKKYASPRSRDNSALWNYGPYVFTLFDLIAGSQAEQFFALGNGSEGCPSTRVAGVINLLNTQATFSITDEAELKNDALFQGSHGWLYLHAPFFCSQRLESSMPIFSGNKYAALMNRVIHRNIRKDIFSDPHIQLNDQYAGFYMQALAATNAIRNQEMECRISSWSHTLRIIEMLAKIEAII
jgi:predicted dehydrogenase